MDLYVKHPRILTDDLINYAHWLLKKNNVQRFKLFVHTYEEAKTSHSWGGSNPTSVYIVPVYVIGEISGKERQPDNAAYVFAWERLWHSLILLLNDSISMHKAISTGKWSGNDVRSVIHDDYLSQYHRRQVADDEIKRLLNIHPNLWQPRIAAKGGGLWAGYVRKTKKELSRNQAGQAWNPVSAAFARSISCGAIMMPAYNQANERRTRKYLFRYLDSIGTPRYIDSKGRVHRFLTLKQLKSLDYEFIQSLVPPNRLHRTADADITPLDFDMIPDIDQYIPEDLSHLNRIDPRDHPSTQDQFPRDREVELGNVSLRKNPCV